jgi:predicted phage terminase large subunit-like protein
MSLAPTADPFALAADILDPPADSDREIAEACSKSLKRFVREAWPIVEPATPFVDGWHIDVICEHLEAVSAGDLRRLIVNIPPRAMKSLTTCVFWPSWEWLTKPYLRWLFASYASDLSLRDSVKCRRLIQSRGGAQEGTIFQRRGYQGVLATLGADPWALTGDQNAKEKYENTATGFRLATSVDGVATGEGGDRIVVDDPVNAKEARSEALRGGANRWWDETMTTRFNNDEATAVIVMQRLHEDDLTGHLAAQESGWHHLCLPAEYEPAHPFVYPAKVKLPSGRVLAGDPRTEESELLEPVRLSYRRLAEILKSMGSYGYAGQMQQRPSPADGGMFKRHWWKRWTALPPQWQRVVCTWDMRFSDSQKAASSYVVGQVWGQDGADRYLLAQIRARLSFTDSVKAVNALSAFRPEARAKLVEKKANGDAVVDTLKKKVTGLILLEPEGGKDVRAAACEPTVEAGNVYLPASEYIPCPAGYEPTTVEAYIEEHAVFPNGSHDDQVDAMTQALNWLESKSGGVSTESYMESHEEAKTQRGDLTLRGERYIDKK